jgi:hypothetical protein
MSRKIKLTIEDILEAISTRDLNLNEVQSLLGTNKDDIKRILISHGYPVPTRLCTIKSVEFMEKVAAVTLERALKNTSKDNALDAMRASLTTAQEAFKSDLINSKLADNAREREALLKLLRE